MKAKLVKESIEFKRTGDTIRSTNIGVYRNRIIEKYLQPIDEMFWYDEWEWINRCPPLMKDLGVKKLEDLENLLGFDIDFIEEEYGEDREEMMKEYSPISDYKKYQNILTGVIWRWTKGELPNGSKVIYYNAGMSDGYLSRKDWMR